MDTSQVVYRNPDIDPSENDLSLLFLFLVFSLVKAFQNESKRCIRDLKDTVY
jgi:hypothetical protein